MFYRFVNEKYLHKAYLFLYLALAVFIPLNKIGLSMAILLLGLITVLFTPLSRFKEVFKLSKSSLPAALLLGWSLLSLLWTEDVLLGFKYINLVLPFYIVFFVLAIHPITEKKERALILNTFIATVVIAAGINWSVYRQQTDYYDYDMREMSLFVSHIRFALMVVIALILSFFYFFKSQSNRRFIYLPVFVFLVYYTYISGVLNGYISVVVAFVGFCVYLLFRYFQSKKIAWTILLLFSLGIAIAGGLIGAKLFSKPDLQVLTHTKQGNLYWSDTTNTLFENGYPITVNIQREELRAAWEERSLISLDSLAKNGMSNESNLIRYMASKGLNKDAEGVSQLTEIDIQNVENGFVSILQNNNSICVRLQRLADELAYTGSNPNGLTFLQRLAYWKAGLAIVKEHPIAGVGAGSSKTHFLAYYQQTNSKLTLENQRESHQQFLAIAVNFGLVGLGLFLWFLLAVFLNMPREVHFLLIGVVLLISFFSEDTLETQTGATLVAFFFSLFGGFSTNCRKEQNRLDN